MRGFLASLFGSSSRRREATTLLEAITRQARLPAFYDELGAPDTLDGRFDLMALHGALVFPALRRKGGAAADLAQRATDLMFEAFDDAIRSLGVGDNGVPRRVKTMAKAYIGRAAAYDEALQAGDEAALAAAIARNIYRGEAPPDAAGVVARYALGASRALKSRSLDAIRAGDLGFSHPLAEIRS